MSVYGTNVCGAMASQTMWRDGIILMDSKTDQSYAATQQTSDFSSADDPLALFGQWMKDAEGAEINDPNAMSLATVDGSGLPNARMVLLKHADVEGFVFYTNLGSVKARELSEIPKAALCFHWKSLRRQVRVRGQVQPVSEEEAEAYFKTRSKGSQIGAWASKQSMQLETRFALEKRIAKFTAKFNIGEVPRPQFWSGFRLVPLEIEFWHDRPYRLHDRIVYSRDGADQVWRKVRLYP